MKNGKETTDITSYLVDVVVEPDQDEEGNKGFHAFCPALKGCHTEGDTYEEAIANICEAVESYIYSLIKHGELVPFQPIDTGKHAIPVIKAPAVLVNVA